MNYGSWLAGEQLDLAVPEPPLSLASRLPQESHSTSGTGCIREWFPAHCIIGKLVVDLISDKATVELTSWIPGTRDSFSKKKRS